MHTLLVGPMNAFSELGLGSLSGLDWVVVVLFAFIGLAMLASLVLALVLVVYSLLRVISFAFDLMTSAQRRRETSRSLRLALSRCRATAASLSGSKSK